MDMKGHFWFSEKKKAHLYREGNKKKRFAKIEGELVVFNEWTQKKKPAGKWGDYVYLGEGEYHHSEPRQ